MKRFVAAAAALLFLAGCSAQPEAPVTRTISGHAVIGLAQPLSGDYLFTEAWGICEADRDIQRLIYGAGTVAVTGEGTFVTDGATLKSFSTREEWDGARTYTFTLNEGLCYSDGSPIGAADYVFSVLLQSSPAFAALGADNSRYSHLNGWEAFSSGESEAFAGVRLLGDDQFSLTISADVLPYYQELSLVEVFPLPMAILAPDAALTADGNGTAKITLSEMTLRQTVLAPDGYRYHPSVTAGAYTVSEVSARGLVLAANPYYNGGVNMVSPAIGTLELRAVDAAHMADMDGFDLICGVSGAEGMAAAMKLVEKEAETRCFFYESTELSAILFGEEVPAPVRQAVAALLDQDECTDLLAGRWGSPVVGMAPQASSLTGQYYGDLRRFSAQWYDLALAGELLKGTAYHALDDGREPVPLIFYYDRADSRGKAMASLLQETAGESGLLVIKPEGLTAAELAQRQQSGDYQLLFFNGSLPADAAPWDGPEILTGDILKETAFDLAHTPAAFPDRYEEKWLAFQEAYQRELPALAVCGYERCDLVGGRLVNYQDVSVWQDWTSLILKASLSE